MQYFVLVYNHREGSVDVEEFGHMDLSRALARRFELERELRADSSVEVVLLAATSRDDLKQTHARYFKSARELAQAS
jgi:hypothetical protein